jgi:hypothetical protein
MTRCLVAALLGLLPVCVAWSGEHEFRVDTEIFVGDEKEPVAETLTIFSGGRVYDFLLTRSQASSIQEVTIFEPARGQFTLLDPQRKLRCTVANQELLDYVLELNKAAIEERGSLFAAAADPQFEIKEEKPDDSAQPTRLTLSSKLVTYAATGKPAPHADASESFKLFADWYARLNATRGGNLPPGARLALNKELAARGLLPEEITRTTVEPGFAGRKLLVRSRHLFNWTLSGADRKRIEEAGGYLINFRPVGFGEFRTAPPKRPTEKTTKR